MDAQWLTLFAAKSTLLLLAGAAAAATLRRAGAGARHLVWLATLAGVLALPGLLSVAPLRLEVLPARIVPGSERGPLPAAEATVTPDRPRSASAGAATVPVAAVPSVAGAERRAEAPSRFRSPSPRQWIFGLWALGAALLAGRLLASSLAARRIVRSARPLDDARWTALMRDLADRLDLPEVPPLVSSDRTEMPFACGAFRTAIVLPAQATEWSEERRQMVLLHELAHVRRRDLLAHGLSRVACALYWFHPLVWSAARRLRAEGERACDDLVLECGARASDYAGHLLDILTTARRPGAPATVLPMARRKEFEGRLLAILDPVRSRRGLRPAHSAALLAGLAAVFVSVAAASPAPRPKSSDSSPVAPFTASSSAPSALSASSPTPASVTPAAGRLAVAQKPEKERERDREGEHDSDREDDRRALLVRVLRSDPDPSVRRSAAWALDDSARPDEVGVLIATLRGDSDAGVREMAAWALAEARGEDTTAALSQALRRDADPPVRATAAWALGERKLSDVSVLVAALGDNSPDVQGVAIWAIGQQRPPSAPAELTAMLRAPNPETRLRAGWALGEIGDPATAPALRAAFVKEDNVESRRAIFRALAFLGDRSPEFLDRAVASKDPEIRSRAVLMLGGQGPGIWPWPWPWPQPRPMP